MSQRNVHVLPVDFDTPELGGGNYPIPNANAAPGGETNFSDGSEPLFSMYLERADDEDQKMVDSWKGDAEGILVFTGLFSAVVATLLQVSLPNLQLSSQDASAFYLANVYQLLSNENGTIPSSVISLNPASFTVPASAVWVNSLWLLSLAISVTCALLATLLQQWARRYLRLTHPRCSPHKRARIRAFFAEGVDRLHLPWTVEALPTLLHISVFLFFAGLGVYLFGVHKTVFSVVIAWVGLCVIVYAYVTFLPIRHKDSPYHAPLSTFIWFCIAAVRYTFFSAPDIPPPRSNNSMPGTFVSRDLEDDRSRSLSSYSLSKAAEDCASRLPGEIDYRALEWTFDSLDQDSELEQFFEGVPDFCNSKVVDNPVGGFIRLHNGKLSTALTVLMDRTLSSSLVSEPVKQRRITICTRAISAANLFGPWWILPRVLLGDWEAFLRSVDFGLFLKDWSRVDRPITTYYAQCVVAVIISSVAPDDRWAQLVTRQITASKSVLRRYFTHGDSILLANLNNILRQTLRTSLEIGDHYEVYIKNASCGTLESMCKLDARDTSPELQNDFCKLWNELADAARNDQRPYVRTISLATLKNIRKVYISLHEGPQSPPTAFAAFAAFDDSDLALDNIISYPTCTINSHRSPLSSGPPNVQGQPPTGGGNASQPPVSHPTALHLPPASMTSTMLMPLPTPVSPPVQNASQVFPGHQSAGPTVQRANHVNHSAPQAPPNSSSTSPGFPVPMAFPTPGPSVPQPNP
ncbi:hypothetical protein V8E53_004816 [Lactarius tabidus]